MNDEITKDDKFALFRIDAVFYRTVRTYLQNVTTLIFLFKRRASYHLKVYEI
mgnify:CR=1 FL=1